MKSSISYPKDLIANNYSSSVFISTVIVLPLLSSETLGFNIGALTAESDFFLIIEKIIITARTAAPMIRYLFKPVLATMSEIIEGFVPAPLLCGSGVVALFCGGIGDSSGGIAVGIASGIASETISGIGEFESASDLLP